VASGPCDKTDVVLRDFIYLDSDRVRSLLAQLDGGVVEQVVERAKTTGQGEAGGRFFGLFDLRGSLARERTSEQTKTTQDAIYFVFEEAAEELGLFTELEEFADPAPWLSGAVHAHLSEGQLLRSSAPTRILDAHLFRERAHRFVESHAARADRHQSRWNSPRPTRVLAGRARSIVWEVWVSTKRLDDGLPSRNSSSRR